MGPYGNRAGVLGRGTQGIDCVQGIVADMRRRRNTISSGGLTVFRKANHNRNECCKTHYQDDERSRQHGTVEEPDGEEVKAEFDHKSGLQNRASSRVMLH